jgi:transposase-like protein
MNRMLAGVSTRKYAGVGEPVGEEVERESRSTSKSTVSELFIERTRTALEELMGRRLDDVRLAVMMLDGMEIAERTHVVALGITTDGVKLPLGLYEGSTENATVATVLLSDLVDRGLDPEAGNPLRYRRRRGHPPGDQGRVRRACAAASVSAALSQPPGYPDLGR